MSAGYYEKKQEILQKKACERYEDLYEKDKKKHQYACKRYRKLSEEEKYGQYDHKEYNNFSGNEK